MNAARTVSAILNGQWAIEPTYAINNMPLILSILEGNFKGWGKNPDGEPVAYSLGDTNMVQTYYRMERTIEKLRESPKGSILEINIEHAITRNDNCGDMGSLSIAKLVNEVNAMENIAGVLFCMNTPGGQVSGMASAISALQNCSKPTTTYIEDGISASAGYWLASQTDNIYVSSKRSSVGSLGAYVTLMNMKARLETAGINILEIYSRYSTDKNGTYRAAIDGNEEPMKDDLDYVVEGFVEDVKAGRGINAVAGEGPFTGKMYYAEEAEAIGLIDGIRTKEQVVAELVSKSNNGSKTRYFV